MNTVPHYDPLTFGETALKLRSYRHELLSSNLVNADTPNYKARDIDFPNALAQQLSGQFDNRSIELAVTHPAHIALQVVPSGPLSLYRIPVQPAIDGNTVDPDLERGHFVKNSFFTESALSFLGSTLRTRLSAITGQAS